MSTEAIPLFSQYNRSESCVVETRYSVVGLYVVVEVYTKAAKPPVHLEIYFRQDRGFVLLNEGDMPSWLGDECFRTNHIVYRISDGGWFGNFNPKESLLSIASAQCSEWLIVTANECVSVFSDSEPMIREL
jgi:hypothetical protein